jgi:hypothetical protein
MYVQTIPVIVAVISIMPLILQTCGCLGVKELALRPCAYDTESSKIGPMYAEEILCSTCHGRSNVIPDTKTIVKKERNLTYNKHTMEWNLYAGFLLFQEKLSVTDNTWNYIVLMLILRRMKNFAFTDNTYIKWNLVCADNTQHARKFENLGEYGAKIEKTSDG